MAGLISICTYLSVCMSLSVCRSALLSVSLCSYSHLQFFFILRPIFCSFYFKMQIFSFLLPPFFESLLNMPDFQTWESKLLSYFGLNDLSGITFLLSRQRRGITLSLSWHSSGPVWASVMILCPDDLKQTLILNSPPIVSNNALPAKEKEIKGDELT